MNQNSKNRDRFLSQPYCLTEQQYINNLTSLTVKPHEDPDTPPALQLEEFKIEEINSDQNTQEEFNSLELSPPTRPRTRSEDHDYTILGFLQKLRPNRPRVMSEVFHDYNLTFHQKE